jgi:hypothetical protein
MFVQQKVSLAELQTLMQQAAPKICGVVVHHTYRPSAESWGGKDTLLNIQAYYRNTYGWQAGPHIFAAPDGIWISTPLSMPGIHAAQGNGWGGKHSIGVEVVHDGTRYPFGHGTAEAHAAWEWGRFACAVVLHALGVRDVPAPQAFGVYSEHRNYNKPSCPGGANSPEHVREGVQRALRDLYQQQAAGVWGLWGTQYPLSEEAKTYAIPQAWLPVAPRLGAAVTGEIHSDKGAYQGFERGVILWRKASGTTVVEL